MENREENSGISFQFLSCAAIEFVCFQVSSIPIVADCIILAGNISAFASIGGIEYFIEYLSSKFKHVFYVPGPLEYQGGPLELGDKTCDALLEEIGRENVHILGVNGNHTYLFPEHKLRIIGVKLWGDDPEVYFDRTIGDTLKTAEKKISIKRVQELHLSDLEIITLETRKAKERGERVIVISHGCPTTTINKQEERKNEKKKGS